MALDMNEQIELLFGRLQDEQISERRQAEHFNRIFGRVTQACGCGSTSTDALQELHSRTVQQTYAEAVRPSIERRQTPTQQAALQELHSGTRQPTCAKAVRPSIEHAKSEFDKQKSRTQQAACAFKKQLDALEAHYSGWNPNNPNLDKQTVDALKKLQFMTLQMASAKQLITTIESQIAVWTAMGLGEVPTPEQTSKECEFYLEAAQLLHVLEDSFRKVACVPLSKFSRAFDAWKGILTEHPKLCAGAAVAGGGLGLFFGAGLHGLLGFPHGILHLGLHAKLAQLGYIGAGLVGGVGGAAGGIFVVSLVLGLLNFVQYQRNTRPADEVRRDVEAKLKELEKKDLEVDALVGLADLYRDCYVQPVAVVLEVVPCMICLEDFTVMAPKEKRAVTAVNCRSNHFMHKECIAKWERQSNDLRCIYCRQ